MSAGKNNFNRDYHGQTASGDAQPMMNVFTRTNGITRHFWGSEMLYAPADRGQDPRHLGLLEPSCNMLDLTRAGRKADWDAQLQYGDALGTSPCACATKT